MTDEQLERAREVAGDLHKDLHKEGFEGIYDGDDSQVIWDASNAIHKAIDLIIRRRREARA